MIKRKLLLMIPALLLASCGGVTTSENTTNTLSEETSGTSMKEEKEMSVIAPSGAPALGLVHYFSEHKEKSSIVSADSLAAEFNKKEKDAIVAPINLGVKMYNTNKNYKLFKTITWGNLYIVAKASEKISSISDLEGKTITAFGSKTVPEIVLTSVLTKNNVKANVTYDAKEVNDVISLFVANSASIILAAEPVLSKVKAKLGSDITIISLQEEYKKLNNSSYPQAAIFVNDDYLQKYSDKYMSMMLSSIDKMKTDIETSAKVAVEYDTSFATIGETALISAIPNCSFDYKTDSAEEKAAVEQYLGYIDELNLGASYGNVKPDYEFYI